MGTLVYVWHDLISLKLRGCYFIYGAAYDSEYGLI